MRRASGGPSEKRSQSCALPAKCFIFYGGATPLYMDGIAILPVEQALRNLGQILDAGGAS